MSTDARLAALEALARENQEKIEELNHKNWLLSNQNIKMQEELAKLEEDAYQPFKLSGQPIATSS
ncbi:hypothetical protein J4E85_009271 [Alternaria conjuncta]|uniref:uncharacterized protein n=1 Tax=Alternaria conjuncta TaxID=181017 RepID=UPI00222099BC|nr:uncharacterized protein J4E85_009271 [Alternaria conjuncta]KAI4920504.1 hypothetical protein J4E85_009271 [Alternaria conjuncta]